LYSLLDMPRVQERTEFPHKSVAFGMPLVIISRLNEHFSSVYFISSRGAVIAQSV
jgi:hypothetical protein